MFSPSFACLSPICSSSSSSNPFLHRSFSSFLSSSSSPSRDPRRRPHAPLHAPPPLPVLLLMLLLLFPSSSSSSCSSSSSRPLPPSPPPPASPPRRPPPPPSRHHPPARPLLPPPNSQTIGVDGNAAWLLLVFSLPPLPPDILRGPIVTLLAFLRRFRDLIDGILSFTATFSDLLTSYLARNAIATRSLYLMATATTCSVYTWWAIEHVHIQRQSLQKRYLRGTLVHSKCFLSFDTVFLLSTTMTFLSSPLLAAKVQRENTLGAFLPFGCSCTLVLQDPTPATSQEPHLSLSWTALGVHDKFKHPQRTE